MKVLYIRVINDQVYPAQSEDKPIFMHCNEGAVYAKTSHFNVNVVPVLEMHGYTTVEVNYG